VAVVVVVMTISVNGAFVRRRVVKEFIRANGGEGD